MPRPQRRLPTAKSMIVAPQPEAVEAGARMLEAGGNAVDATLACAFTQGVVDPMMCGIGGLGTMQIFDPHSGKHVVINGLSSCPAAASETMWSADFERECSNGYGYVVKDAVNELGHRSVTVPGIVRVFAEAHTVFGSQPWNSLFQQAIAIANEGWAIRPMASVSTCAPTVRRSGLATWFTTPNSRRRSVSLPAKAQRRSTPGRSRVASSPT